MNDCVLLADVSLSSFNENVIPFWSPEVAPSLSTAILKLMIKSLLMDCCPRVKQTSNGEGQTLDFSFSLPCD